ncbi:MAG: hypothetical protein DDT27_00802 [Dehalococcoidia bacterium]|nr:hypothetical protein [Chloroflexota bacterium]
MVPLGIDKEKFCLQLERLEERYARLVEARSKLQQDPNDSLVLAAAERLLQTLIEECINIGNHIIAGLNLKRPDTYREVFFRLREKEVLSEEVGEKLMGFASFRNRLVHLYWRVEQEEVLSKLGEIEFTKEFAEEVYSYLKTQKLL